MQDYSQPPQLPRTHSWRVADSWCHATDCMGMLPGTEYLPAFVPVGKWFLSHVRWSPQLISLLLGAKHGILFIYLCLKLISPFIGCGKERLVSGAACPHALCKAELAACLTPGEESHDPGDCGRECGSPRFGLGISAMACSLSCAFLRRGSLAFDVLSTARFCGVPVGLVEMPWGSDLAADWLGQRGKL